jgi:hypothetical protein
MKLWKTAAVSVSAIALAALSVAAYEHIWPDRETGACAVASNYEEFAEPEQDAQKAAAAGDFFLRGTYGFTVDIPGIRGDVYVLRDKYRITVIEGTEHIVCVDPDSYNNVAARYAFQFNRRMFQLRGCDPDKPMEPCRNY